MGVGDDSLGLEADGDVVFGAGEDTTPGDVAGRGAGGGEGGGDGRVLFASACGVGESTMTRGTAVMGLEG